MKQFQTTLPVRSTASDFTDVTRWLNDFVTQTGVRTGLLTAFIQHTSAGLTIQENADPDVLRDLKDFFDRVSPHDDSLYVHNYEGSDDMPAHIRSSLTDVSLSIPVSNGRMALGRWQAVYLCEHRDQAHIRNIVLHLIGE